MKIIGLTGGTGTGKTTALRALEKMGAYIIDCDEVYHELLENSAGMKTELGARFPGAITGGRLDRKALGAMVFNDDGAMADLNAITHKFIGDEIDRRLAGQRRADRKVAALDAILLIESGLGKKCHVTVGVTAPTELRIQRIMARDGISREYAEMRINAQKPDKFFHDNCDYVLDNSNNDMQKFSGYCKEFFEKILSAIKEEE